MGESQSGTWAAGTLSVQAVAEIGGESAVVIERSDGEDMRLCPEAARDLARRLNDAADMADVSGIISRIIADGTLLAAALL